MTNHTRLVAIAASLAAASSSLSGTVGPNHVDPPTTVSLTGVVRDFRERTVAGGHPDFERRPAHGPRELGWRRAIQRDGAWRSWWIHAPPCFSIVGGRARGASPRGSGLRGDRSCSL